ncbi:alpha/beta fold hydrolase [Aeromicrobium sp. SMF47]|uniref:Alpha/beta fold hydrolase n=1 Tax=Aeromicrobium yanjiei TaxID=2662028 RepID=A0A5Q2MJH7_9ACTN|nr:alpha/beta hydrolase [Aeromicrobium yanjiei]MRJ75473.1 alpha/beta fold hydrolase [Aeromicrobium yanjiei]QGG40100.1 alpha/beta fold hydrolase [Aeromicrobium yanjiei]
MAEIEINGGQVVYEFVGPEDGEVVVLTPGGRFSKDFPGVRPLAEAFAAGGKRVLLWDRPNCGASDIQLYGKTESHMRAETLGLMLQKLETGPVVVTGGSGGARDSIVFTMMYPELAKRLAVWSIVGGTFSSMSLAAVYVLSELRTVRAAGIEGVMTMPGLAGSWADLIEANPRNKERMLDIGAAEFERVMTRWLDAYVPKPNESIPGVADWEFEAIDIPTLIIRGGEKDYDHPKRTSFEVHALIKNSRLIEPPWPEDAWERASEARNEGRGNIFDPWIQAAPVLLDFMNETESDS